MSILQPLVISRLSLYNGGLRPLSLEKIISLEPSDEVEDDAMWSHHPCSKVPISPQISYPFYCGSISGI